MMIMPILVARSSTLFHRAQTVRAPHLLAHGAGSPLAEISLLCLGLGNALGESLSVLVGSILGLLGATALECDAVALVLQTLGSNQTLDLWCLRVWLLSLALWLNLTTDNKLANIIILGETEESSDLCSTLRAKTLWVDGIGDAWDVGISLLDDAEGEDRQIHGDDAAADGLALTLTSSAGSVAGVALGEEKADTSWVHNALLHRETLLVIASRDLEDVTLEFVSNAVTWNFGTHTLLHENAESALIVDFDHLLAAIGRVGDVQLHDHSCR